MTFGISLTVSRVRVAAAESMPLLLECARVRGPEYLTQMWLFMCDALIKAIGTEPDSDVLSEIMHSFAKVTNLSIVSPLFPGGKNVGWGRFSFFTWHAGVFVSVSVLSWWETAVWTTSILRSWAASWKESWRNILRTRSSDKVRHHHNHRFLF